MRWRSRRGVQLHHHRGTWSLARRLRARPAPPSAGGEKAAEAVELATTRIREAQQLLARYRDDESAPELRTAYDAVHSAVGDLAAARHWRTLEERIARAAEQDTEEDAG